MNYRNANQRRTSSLSYQLLEPRQLLTSIAYNSSSDMNVPQDGSKTILTNLNEAPEIVEQPEHGQLIFDQDAGTLSYRPEQGFAGNDSFQINNGGRTNTTNVRVWESTYAVPDWTLVKPGESTSIAALENDYAFRNANENTSYAGWAERFVWQQNSSGFRIVSFTSNSGATISISEDGQLLNYTSADGFIGEDVVTYTLENELGHRSESTVTFEVTAQDLDTRYYVSEAQLRQQQIENWMERYASSIGRHRFVDRIVLDGPDGVWGRVVTFSFAATNNVSAERVANVQEGDIVKAHGDFLYYVTHDDGSGDYSSYLSIVDLSDPTDPKIISTTGFDHKIRDIFLDDGRVAVVMDGDPRLVNPWLVGGHDGHRSGHFQFLVMDVTDSENPTEVYRASIDGSYTDARLIGDQLFVISSTGNDVPSPWQLENTGLAEDAVSPGNFIDALFEYDPNIGIPTITIDANGTTEVITVSHDQVVNRDDTSMSTLITTFDLQSDSGQPVDVDLVETNWIRTVYVSSQSMYLFDGNSVIKLDFLKQDAGLQFSADGELDGRLISQFAADEYAGHLRVAITDNQDSSSDILVFKQVGDSLVVTSSLEDIAPGEQVFSARFEADKAFVVTFRRVDPLFIIDLADPDDAKIAGELKIPGVSNYLQWIGDGLLLAVGRDANPNTGRIGALQVSLFDVSDANNPQLLDRYSFEGGITTSTPLIQSINSAPEHHALTFDRSTGTLALPIFSSNHWQAFNDQPIFEGDNSAFSLFKVDRNSGIQVVDQVKFASKALRTVVVGENLVYLSEDGLKTATRQTPDDIIASIELPNESAQQLAARPVTSDPTPINPTRSTPLFLDTIASIQSRALLLAPSLTTRLSSLLEPQFVTNAEWTERNDSSSQDAGDLPGAINETLVSDVDVEVVNAELLTQSQAEDSSLDRFFSDFDDLNDDWNQSTFEKAG